MAYPYYQTYQPYYQPQSGIIWVGGLAEAQTYPVAPNNAVALWEQSGKAIYLKQADATGRPSIRIFDLVERTETAQIRTEEPEKHAYATKDEIGAVLSAVKEMASEIEQMKSDLYGVAGRKKAKKEITDDDT